MGASMRVKSVTLTSLIVLATSVSAFGQGSIPWVHSFETAQQLAQRDQRLLLVHFYADWCGPCRSLEQTVFSDPSVGRSVAAHYVPVKINVDQSPELAKRYGVSSIPTDVIVDCQGQVLYQTRSPNTSQDYLQLLQGLATGTASAASAQPVAARFGPQAGHQAAGAAAAAQQWQGAPGHPEAIGAYAQQQPENNGWGGVSHWQDRADAAVSASSLDPQAGHEEAWRQSTWQDSPQASMHSATTPSPNSRDRQPTAPNSPVAGLVENPYGQPGGQAPPAPQAAATSGGGFPLALDGFCAVLLAEQEQWQRGDAAWGAIHRGRTYLFSSQEFQQRFLADPDRYSPVLSGLDPTRYVDTGEPVPGLRQHGMWFRGKIYLFADEASLLRFSQKPEYYAQRAHEIMMMAGR
jgi:protein disulfide-isomerase